MCEYYSVWLKELIANFKHLSFTTWSFISRFLFRFIFLSTLCSLYFGYFTISENPSISIRSSEKFLSFYKEIIDTQYFPFYIILSNYVWSSLFYQTKDHNVRQIKFGVCIKMRCCKRRVCKRKILSGQPNVIVEIICGRSVEQSFFCRFSSFNMYKELWHGGNSETP